MPIYYPWYKESNNWIPPAPIAPTPQPKRIVIPKLPEPEIVEYQCGECGMVFRQNQVMGYVCGNMRCPVFPVITCSAKDTPIPGGWI